MKLTREEAIVKFREHWKWLSENPEAEKWEAPMVSDGITVYCFLCHYTSVDCRKCPIQWPSTANWFMCESSNDKNQDDGLWLRWKNAHDDKDYKLAAKLALQIANLPEREEEE